MLLGTFVSANVASATSPTVSIVVNGQPLAIPPPAGMISVKGADPNYDRLLVLVTPPGNVMHAAFVPIQKWANYLRHGSRGVAIWNYAYVESDPQAPTDPAQAAKEYEQGREVLRIQHCEMNPMLLDEMRKGAAGIHSRIQEVYSNSANLEQGTPIPLATIRDTNQSIAVTYLTAHKDSLPDGRILRYTMLSGSALVPLHSRLLYLFYFQRLSLEPAEARAQAEAAAKAFLGWMDAIATANP
jgi:hypothetical protein